MLIPVVMQLMLKVLYEIFITKHLAATFKQNSLGQEQIINSSTFEQLECIHGRNTYPARLFVRCQIDSIY